MKKQIFLVLLAACSLGLASCACAPTGGEGEESSSSTSLPVEKTLESIEAKGYRTEYYVDEAYDPIGLKVTATYSDASTRLLAGTEYTVSGFDSSVANDALTLTVSYTEGEITKTTSFNVQILPQEEEVKCTLNIAVNVSGIESYTDFHSHIYINTSLVKTEDNKWDTKVLTQDETDSNLWTISFPEILVEQVYSLNFYYGSNEGANWDYGKNKLESTDPDACLSLEINEEDMDSEGNVNKSFTATFEVPDLSSVTVDCVVTPSLLKTSTSEEEALSDGVYVWAWNNATNSNVRFEKSDTDGKWHYELTVAIDATTLSGSLKCSFTLGLESAPDWAHFGGEWEDESFVQWTDVEKTVTNESTTVEYTVHFKDEPVVPSGDSYNLTVNISFGETYNYVGLRAGTSTNDQGKCYVNNPIGWVSNMTESEGTYSVKYYPDLGENNTELYFAIEIWNDGFSSNAFVGANTSWEAFHISFTQANASITLTSAAITAGDTLQVGTVVSSEGLTIL